MFQDLFALYAGFAVLEGNLAAFTRPGAIVNPDIDCILNVGRKNPWDVELQRYIRGDDVPLPPVYVEFAEWWRCQSTVDMRNTDLIDDFRRRCLDRFVAKANEV